MGRDWEETGDALHVRGSTTLKGPAGGDKVEVGLIESLEGCWFDT